MLLDERKAGIVTNGHRYSYIRSAIPFCYFDAKNARWVHLMLAQVIAGTTARPNRSLNQWLDRNPKQNIERGDSATHDCRFKVGGSRVQSCLGARPSPAPAGIGRRGALLYPQAMLERDDCYLSKTDDIRTPLMVSFRSCHTSSSLRISQVLHIW